MPEDLPPLVTKLTADLGGLDQGLARGKTEVKAWKQEVASEFNGGRSIGAGFGKDVADGIQDAIPAEFAGKATGERLGKDVGGGLKQGVRDAAESAGDEAATGITTRLRDSRGRFIRAGQDIGDSIGDGISKGVDPGLDEVERKVVDKTKKAGQDAGNAAGEGMSPLIVSALVGAAALGGPLLVAGIGTAMVGATALIEKQNKVISADFAKTGKDAASEVEQAAAPLAGTLNQALIGVDKQVKAMAPDLKSMFSAAAPDIADVTSGLTGLVGGVLPGLSSALSRGQVIVSDFSQSLPVLGADIGRFFSSLVGNADLQGRALQGTLNSLGNTVYTVGSLMGSASTALAPPLLGLTHTVNGLDDAIRAVGSPAVVGGALGALGALKLDPKIQSGLLSGAEGLSKLADKASESGGTLGKVEGAASRASGVLGKMAGVVGGPWGIAIGAGIGLATGLAAALDHADDATKAITVSQGNLAAAVQQDGAKAGQATSAYIAQQAQVSGLADEAKSAGVSLSLLTEAATGNQAALSQLTAATGAANEVGRQQQLTTVAQLDGQAQLAAAHEKGSVAVNTLYGSTVQLASAQDQLNSSFTTGSTRLAQGLVASNSLTDANQQLLASVRAQEQQVANEIGRQTELNAAMAALNDTTLIFNATLDADYQKLTASAQAAGQSAAAALDLGSRQSTLNQWLASSVQQYQLATGGANAYGQVLTALNGTENTLLGTEASFTIALDGVSRAAQANGTSLDVNNAKGAQNVQTFTQLASSAQKAAVAVYQNEVGTKGATLAYQDANAKLAAEKQAFIDNAVQAGFNRKAVKDLANELFGLPHDIPLEVNATTAQDQVRGLVRWIDSQTGTITVQTGSGSGASGVAYNPKSGGGKALYDYGGWTRAAPGQPEEAIVHGGEYVLSRDQLAGRQQVDARVLAALRSGGVGLGGGPSPSGGGAAGASGASGDITVYAPVYLDGKLIGQSVTRGSRSSAQQYKVRNSQTGFN